MAGSKPEHGIVIAEDIAVHVRDGVRLATDIYRPGQDGEPAPGRFPTILQRTSYDKSRHHFVEMARYFCERGYVAVVQDLRSRGKSEETGEYLHSNNEKEGMDGYDTVEWIARQPWSDGKVGTIGFSHGGIVQNALAVEDPPHLSAMFIGVSPSNAYHSGFRQNGAFEPQYAGKLMLHAVDTQEAAADPVVKRALIENMTHLRDWLARLPWKEGLSPFAPVPKLEGLFFQIYTGGDYNEFWKDSCINFEEHYQEHADVPTYYQTGWYDSWTRGVTENYVALSKMKEQPLNLIIGSWTHGGVRTGDSYSGDADFGPDAAIDANGVAARWFDRWLKGLDNSIDEEPPVRIFVMGGGDGRKNREGRLNHGGQWRAESEWPLARTQYTPYYLHHDGSLSPDRPGPDGPPCSYLSDPHAPVPSISANVSGFYELSPLPEGTPPEEASLWDHFRTVLADGASHQKEEPHIFGCKPPYLPLSARPDVLVFQTPPLEESVEVTGPIVIKLWASSSAVDTDFTAKLIDVHPPNEDYPQGYDMNLTDSIIRARYRNGWEKGELMTPGEVYEFEFALYPIGNLFTVGHRIRVDISSSAFPHFDVNPNTGEPMGRHTHTVVAHNTVYMDHTRPSHIVLPIIPV